jgi:hypothetical protein
MRLSDIMSAMHLGAYPEVALILFMAAFFAIAVNVFRRRNAEIWERARHMPLEPEHPPTSSRPSSHDETASSER